MATASDTHLIAAKLNTENLVIYKDYNSVEEFLRNDTVRIPLHATTIEDPLSVVDLNYDVDGLCVELLSVEAVKQGIHFLFLPMLEIHNLRNHFFLLRKHVDRTLYSKAGLEVLKNCCGTVIAHINGGYYLNLTAIPKDSRKPASLLSVKADYQRAALEATQ